MTSWIVVLVVCIASIAFGMSRFVNRLFYDALKERRND